MNSLDAQMTQARALAADGDFHAAHDLVQAMARLARDQGDMATAETLDGAAHRLADHLIAAMGGHRGSA